jgi:hypothetical protein
VSLKVDVRSMTTNRHYRVQTFQSSSTLHVPLLSSSRHIFMLRYARNVRKLSSEQGGLLTVDLSYMWLNGDRKSRRTRLLQDLHGRFE